MSLPIDLDSEAVQYDGKWYTRDELARKIKAMLDGGDFAISRPSQALEQLTATVANLRTVAFRATPEMADALNAHAAKAGKSAGQVLREALAGVLGQSAPASAPGGSGGGAEAPRAAAPKSNPGAVPSPAPTPIPLRATTPSQPLPSVMVETGIVTEPASATEAAGAVNLTAKKKDEEEAVERRWFGA
jgi:hypothetical protein